MTSIDFKGAYMNRWVGTSNNSRWRTEESWYEDLWEEMTAEQDLWAPTGSSYRTNAGLQYIAGRVSNARASELDATTYTIRKFNKQDKRDFQESYPKGDIDDLLGIGGAADV